MVQIKKLKRGSKIYYYLEHSVREGAKVYKKRKYLGTTVPKNIAVLKEQIIDDIYKDKWYDQFDKIAECYKKILAKTPKSVQEKNIEAFMVRFTYDTQRIEGSRLSFRDTGSILINKVVPRNAKISDVKEAENHKKVFYLMLKSKKDLSLKLILEWHKILFSDTKPDIAGRIRKYPVLITNSNFFPPKPGGLDYMLSDFFDWYDRVKDQTDVVKLSALAHLKFETIHPFGDGNGRIGRIIMNFILNKRGYPMIDIKYTGRYGYYKSLGRSQVHKNEYAFLEWFFRRYLEENNDYTVC